MGMETIVQKLDEADEEIRGKLKPAETPDLATKDALKKARSLVQQAITVLLGK